MEQLISRDSKGKLRVVEIETCWDDFQHAFLIKRTTYQYGGKKTEQPNIVIERGKASRTLKEQVDLEYKSNMKKYLDKGYKLLEKTLSEYSLEELDEILGEVRTGQNGIPKPMLAKSFDKVTKKDIFDKQIWLASRKIDGVRCLVYYHNGEIHTASRGGEHYDYSTDHIRYNKLLIDLFKQYPTLILDSELYKFGKSLQKISGAARLEKNAYDCDWLELYVYDCFFTDNLNMIAKDRIEFIRNIAKNNGWGFNPKRNWDNELQIQIVPHIEISGWSNIEELHNKYVSEGWEGVVIRDPNKPYKPSGRNNSMIKIKKYLDDEFLVIDYELGLRGSEDMVFILQTQEGNLFKASPFGDRDIKEEYVTNFENKYKYKLATVKYFCYSDGNNGIGKVPLQGKLIAFRDFSDL